MAVVVVVATVEVAPFSLVVFVPIVVLAPLPPAPGGLDAGVDVVGLLELPLIVVVLACGLVAGGVAAVVAH